MLFFDRSLDLEFYQFLILMGELNEYFFRKPEESEEHEMSELGYSRDEEDKEDHFTNK